MKRLSLGIAAAALGMAGTAITRSNSVLWIAYSKLSKQREMESMQ